MPPGSEMQLTLRHPRFTRILDGASDVVVNRFGALKPVFRTTVVQPLPMIRPSRQRWDDHLVVSAPQEALACLEKYVGPFFAKMGSRSSVELSISKMDKAPVTRYKELYYWRTAKKVVDSFVDRAFSGLGISSVEEVVSSMTLTASAGAVFSLAGMKTKGDALQNDKAFDYIVSNPLDHDTPIWKVVPKVEWGHSDDIDANKVRTFIVPPVDHVFWTKLCYDKQNEALKGFWWSAYGFNPYYGGVNRFVEDLSVHKHFFFYDVKGWDRLLPLLKMVHRRRTRNVPFGYKQFAIWCSTHCHSSFLLLPDGTVVFKNWGNNSGSGTTTGDNILAHMYILFCALCEYYGDVQTALKCVARIFGDDNAMSLPYLMPGGPEHLKATFIRVYGEFGLELDPLVYTQNIEDVEFLGFKPKKVAGGFVPMYNIGRIVSAFRYTIGKHTTQAAFSKAWSLTIMASPGPEECFDAMCLVLSNICYRFRNSSDTVVQSFISYGVPKRHECLAFMLGHEGAPRWMEGFKIYDLQNESFESFEDRRIVA